MDRQDTQIYQRQEEDDAIEMDDAIELGDVLEPYDREYAPLDDEPYENELYDEYPDEEYSDYHEEIDNESRFKVAMGVFDTVSILVGAVVILALVAMLVSLVNWLQTDIMHSVVLLQSGLQ